MLRRTTMLAAAGVLMLLAGREAPASVIIYTNEAAWQAAVGATTLEDFTAATAFNTTGAFGPNAYNGFTLAGGGNGNNIGIHSGSVASGGPNTAIPAAFAGQQFFGWGISPAGTSPP